MAQQAHLSSTLAVVATTRSQSQWVAADTTSSPSTWAEAATIDKPQPWDEEDTIEQVSLPHHPSISFVNHLHNLLCARRGQTIISHRKALFSRSEITASTFLATSHSLNNPEALDRWTDINYALDAHGFFN